MWYPDCGVLVDTAAVVDMMDPNTTNKEISKSGEHHQVGLGPRHNKGVSQRTHTRKYARLLGYRYDPFLAVTTLYKILDICQFATTPITISSARPRVRIYVISPRKIVAATPTRALHRYCMLLTNQMV